MTYFTKLLKTNLAILIISAAIAVLPTKDSLSYEARITIIGDDYIGEYGHFNPEDTFKGQLKVVNRYLNPIILDLTREGETTSSIISQVPAVIESNPDLVIVAIGMNDALSKTDPDIMYNALDNLLRELKREQMYVLFLGYHAPDNLEHNYILQFNHVYSNITQRYNITYVGDILSVTRENQGFYQIDGTHPNKWGVEKIVEKLQPHIKRMLYRVKEQREAAEIKNRRAKARAKAGLK